MAKGEGHTDRLLTESEVRDLMDEVLASVQSFVTGSAPTRL